MILGLVRLMPTTVQVSEKTLQMLNELKKELKARSHDEVIKSLIAKRKRIPDSMFGSNRRLKPFSPADEGESHEL
jgi:predicted CopG family antitoxin